MSCPHTASAPRTLREVSVSLLKTDPVIARLETARAALLAATTIEAVKQIADVAAAAELYAKRQHLSEEAIGYAHALKTDALARLGELLRDMPKATGGLPYQARSTSSQKEPVAPTYADLGLDKKTAMVAQQLAALPSGTRQAIAQRETTLTEARRQEQHAARPYVVFPEGKFRVIYADPPWQYRDTRALAGYSETAAEQDYPTMSVAELSALAVADLAYRDSVLLCWATFPLLPDALTVVSAWGFEYKTAFVWQKPRGLFGHYHKADAELLLVATRGSCTPDEQLRRSQIIVADTGGHSRKPEAVREMIDALYVHGPRIELFARSQHEGWAVWGNDVKP